MDKISVIVPVYRVEEYLPKCVESIINQTYKNLEIILVDDGSPDRCGQMCDEYAKEDDRIRVVHKQNGGLSSARNAGLDVATGEYIGFVDSDDYIAPEMYETLYKQIKADGTCLAACKIAWVIDGKVQCNESGKSYAEPFAEFAGKCNYNVSACNRLYNKSLWHKIRFPVGRICEDAFVEHLISGQCDKISCVDKGMYYYFVRNESIMTASYSVKRLDGAQAFLERLDYMLEKKLGDGAKYAFFCVIKILNEARKKLDLKDENNKKIFFGLQNRLKLTFFKKVIFSKVPTGAKMRFMVFCICPEFYSFIYSKRMNKKG